MSTGTGTILGVLRAGAATVCRQCSLGKKEVVRRQWSLPCNRSSFSSVAVYAIGEGWTGALGTGRLDQCIAGHADDRHPLEEADEFPEMPVCMYESNRHEIISCAAGWGHTAFITRERVHHHHQPYQNQQQYPHLSPNTTRTSLPQQQQTDIDTVPTNERQAMATSGADNTFIQPLPADASQSMNMMIPATNNNNTNQLHVTGRPHEFSSLMRLHRLPRRLRQYAVQQTFQSVGGGKDGDHNTASSWMNPVNWVGRAVTFLSDAFHSNSNPDWEIAREHSFLTVPTVVDLTMNHKTNHDNSYNSRQSEEEDDDFSPVQVACSAGLTAVTTASGAVLTFGLNGMGQCGIGQTSNNVWTPSRVTGLSREFAASNRIDLPQSHPIQHTALGLQRTYIPKYTHRFVASCSPFKSLLTRIE